MVDTVILPQLAIDFADKIATKRQAAAEKLGRKPGNGAPTERRVALDISIKGVRCEAAGKIYFNPVKWNAFSKTISGLADLDDFIDIKGIGKISHRLILQTYDEEDWAYVLVCWERHPVYEFLGWAWGSEAKQKRFIDDPVGGRRAYFVDKSILRPMNELHKILRAKQRADERR